MFAIPNKRRLREPILEAQLGMERLSRRRMQQPIAQVGGVWGNLVATHPGRGSRDGNVLRQVGLASPLAAWPRSSLCVRWENRRPVMASMAGAGRESPLACVLGVLATPAMPAMPARAKPAVSLKSSEVALARAQAIMARMLTRGRSATGRPVRTSRLVSGLSKTHLISPLVYL